MQNVPHVVAVIVGLLLAAGCSGDGQQELLREGLLTHLRAQGAELETLPEGWVVSGTLINDVDVLGDDVVRFMISETEYLHFFFGCLVRGSAELEEPRCGLYRDGQRPRVRVEGGASTLILSCQETEAWCDEEYLAIQASRFGAF